MININRINQNNRYSLDNPKINVKRSSLIMRESTQTSGNVGKLIPILVHEMLPSENLKMTQSVNIQFTPFITNVMHEITGDLLTYFVPYRIIWEDWEKFITGCDEENDEVDGTLEVPICNLDKNKLAYEKLKALVSKKTKEELEIIYNEIVGAALEYPKAEGEATDYNLKKGTYANPESVSEPGFLNLAWFINNETELSNNFRLPAKLNNKYWVSGLSSVKQLNEFWTLRAMDKVSTKYWTESLPDYYGIPISFNFISSLALTQADDTSEVYYWHQDETIVEPYKTFVENTIENAEKATFNALNYRAYNKIYNDWIRYIDWEPRREKEDLTIAKANNPHDIFTRARRYQLRGAMPKVPVNLLESTLGNAIITKNDNFAYGFKNNYTGNSISAYFVNIENKNTIEGQGGGNYPKLEVDPEQLKVEGTLNIGGAGEWNILDMVTPAGLLNYYMANARIKPRYSEQLLARWGVTIQDARYQYAQIVDASKISISQNGITQTAPQQGDSTAQGNITGQGWGNGGGKTKFYAPEHGVLITLLQIRPSNAYELGFEAQYQKVTRFDYPTPELVDTPDVPIYAKELAPNAPSDQILGYKGIYDEYRTKFNKVTGLLRPSIRGSLAVKTLARSWDEEIDMESVVKCEPQMSRIKQFTTQPDFTMITQTQIISNLPLPYINDPRIVI